MTKRLAGAAVVWWALGHTAVLGGEMRLRMTSPAEADLPAWHLRTGVPFAKGELTDPNAVELRRGSRRIPVQARVLATWGPPESELGQSIKWLGLDFTDSVKSGTRQEYRLAWRGPHRPLGMRPLAVESAEKIVVRNGRLEMVFLKGAGSGFNLFESVRLDGRTAVPAKGAVRGAFIQDASGTTYWAAHDRAAEVKIEQNGPLAAVIRAEGWFVNPGADRGPVPGEPARRPRGGFCRYITRVYIGAEQPGVRVQHTFILTEDSNATTYRDIGLALPFRAGRSGAARFGGVEGSVPAHAYLLQKSCDAFVVMSVRPDGQHQEVAAGEKAAGWVKAGGLGIAFKDFWQNFPKELEVVPETSQVIAHFWPRHGQPRVGTAETIDVMNAWRLPFVHSGEALDFRIPEVYLDEKVFGGLAGYMDRDRFQSIDQGVHANALGIAKTHELWIDFGDRDFEKRCRVFQAAPHVLADPKYIETTLAFGPLAAADPENFPLSEMRFGRGMKAVIRTHDEVKGYGMWNYRGLHHRFLVRNGQWTVNYKRLWAGFHHGYARLPWWLYVRSGEPEFLSFARANALKLGDIGLCHWTNAAFVDARVERRKRVGGMCDYKGFVPWNRGDRYGYNSMIDIFLYDYYLTGNLRSRDVALEHGYYVARVLNTEGGARTAAGQSDTMTNLYLATWDPEIRPKMVKAAHDMMKRLPHEQHATYWTPWLTRYWDATRDEAARKYLMDWVASEKFVHDGLDKVAYAYYITGDPKYAKRCAERLSYRGSYMYYKDGDFLDAGLAYGWYGWAFAVRDEMLAMKAAEGVELGREDLPHQMYNVLSPRKEPPGGRQRIVIAFRHDGSPREVVLGTSFQYRTTWSRLYAPSGRLLKEATHENMGGKRTAPGDPQVKVTLSPRDPLGMYYLVYENTFSFRPLVPEGEQVWMRSGPDAVFCLRRGRAFFFVPRGSPGFTLKFEPGYRTGPHQSRFMAAGSLFDPDLKYVAHVNCGNDRNPQIIRQGVPPEHRGKVWSITGNDFLVLTDAEGIWPWVSHTYKAFRDTGALPPKELPPFVK